MARTRGSNTSVWLAVSLFLFWRKSTDRAILLISIVLVLKGESSLGIRFPMVALSPVSPAGFSS